MKKKIIIGILVIVIVVVVLISGQELQTAILLAIETDWVKHPANPVLDAGSTWDKNGVSDPSVMFDQGLYKIWFATNDGNYSRIGYAISKDGINWEKVDAVLDRGELGSWEDWSLDTPTVIKDGLIYKMWYAAYPHEPVHYDMDYAYRIGYATSKDGANWVKHPANPVLDVSDTEFVVADPVVIRVGSEYKMWYSVMSQTDIHIAHATSSDGIHWTKHGRVLNPGTSETDWDYLFVGQPSVLFNGQNYEMWYGGGVTEYSTSHFIGYATSEDGIHWEKYKDPILITGDSDDFDFLMVFAPTVIKDKDTYKLWYTGGGGSPTVFRMGLATFKKGKE